MNSVATAVNIWDFYGTEKARQVPCESLWRFYLYAISEGTEKIEIGSVDSNKGSLRMFAYGPVCENESDIPQKGEMQKFCRLVARFPVTKNDVHDKVLGLDEEEKRMLVGAVGEKAGKNTQTTFCKTLNLRGLA